MLWADVSLALDPVWPWSGPGGVVALLAVAGVLTALTLWTYAGARAVGWRQVALLLALRLAALAVICLLVLRPSLAQEDDPAREATRLLLVVDGSESMNVTDEFNNLSRWDHAHRILTAPAVAEYLKKLGQEHKTEVMYYQAAESVGKYDAEGKAEGKRTDMGAWLKELRETHGREKELRGLVLFTDGADNGTRFPTLDQAALWRGVCTLHPFALGKATTSSNLRDIAFTQIFADPQPAPVKGKLTVKGIVNAPGFENATVDASLWLEDDSGEARLAGAVRRFVLKKTIGNEIALSADVPNRPGELKVTLKIAAVPGEVTDVNNTISTYVTVTKEGVSILWVEGRKRAYESIFVLRHALAKDARFRVYYAEKLQEAKPSAAQAAEQADWFQLDKQHYDVIVIGDVTAQRFADGKPALFEKIRERVTKDGTGLLMLGGYDTFANKDWTLPFARPLVNLLPVELNQPGQVEGPVRMLPTEAGLSHFLLRLADNTEQNKTLWGETLEPLDGMTRVGTPKTGATVLAKGDNGEPLLVGTQAGAGRTLVFGGDTTWKAWRRAPDMLPAYERFWKQTMLWLARQEDVEGNAWVKPDVRRLPAGANQRLGFAAGLRGKGGVDLKNAQFTAQVVGPGNDITDVPILLEDSEHRGYFLKTDKPGEYKIEVKAKGKDVDGKEVTGTASARFLTFAEDIENLRLAADHDFLTRLAQAGGGKFHLATERNFLQFLESLVQEQKKLLAPRLEHWPDWKQNPSSPSVADQVRTLWSSAALPCVILFLTLLSLEWVLRRRWGLV